MTDDEIIAQLRRAAPRSTAVVAAETLSKLLPTGLTQSALISYFKRAFPEIPLRVLLDAGGWSRVSHGGVDDDQFDRLLSPWLPRNVALVALDRAVAMAQSAYEAGESVADMEPAFAALVDFIQGTPGVEPAAEARFASAVRDGSLGLELMEFCVHVFRWPAVVAEARRLLGEAEHPELLQGTLHLVAAACDDWEDAELYSYFR